ncbi:MAG: glycosyltransferase 61 family protein [Paracoccaceae bacterium]
MGGERSSVGDWPRIHRFEGITVAPFTELMELYLGRSDHRGGPLFPNWESAAPVRFHRRGVPFDAEPEQVPPEAEAPPGAYYWIGPVLDHFGHLVTDFTTRIVPALATDPTAILVFAGHRDRGPKTVAESPAVFRALLDWHGVAPERVRLLDRPTRFAVLHVPEQPEQDGIDPRVAPDPAYLDALTARAAERLGRPAGAGTLYVSRGGLAARFAGEGYLEAAMTRAGAQVLRPETLPLREQLAAYAAAETMVFAEGSAVHGLQLLGRGLGRVAMLRRRAMQPIAMYNLPPRVAGFDALDTNRITVTGLMGDGVYAHWKGLSILRPDRLLEGLAALGLDLRPHWDPNAFAEAEAADLDAWIRAEAPALLAAHSGSRKVLLGALRRSGLASAEGAARTLLALDAARSPLPQPAARTLSALRLGFFQGVRGAERALGRH